VKKDLLATGRFLALPTLALALVVAFLPGRVEVAVRIYVLVVCCFALALTIAALRRAFPTAASLRPAPGRETGRRRRPPGSLARLEQEVVLGVASAFDLHHRLRPQLRGLASELLTTRRAVSLDAEPRSAQRLLGDETWGLVRVDRPPPEDRLARGLSLPEIERVVESLERI
jgi:hypothetical protein